MDFDVRVLEALVRERLDDLRHEARLHALARRASGRRRGRLRPARVGLGRLVAGVGAVLVTLGRRIGGEAVPAARP